MDTYTVKEVAKMMNTSEETVRRWIRSGKLKANMDSRKKGSVITDAMLREFTRNTPKYAAALANPIGGIVAASTLLLGTFVAKNIENVSTQNTKAKNKTKEENTMENTPQENIIEELFQARYEKLDNILIKKIHKIKATNKEEKESIKNAIIMEEMYKQGFKDGINLIMQCQKSQ